MNKVLWISVIGAALVILGLMLLWFLMDILVRITNMSRKKNRENEGTAFDYDQELDLECKQKAAAASIAVAMALMNTSFLSTKQKSGHQMSAWQIGNRSKQIYNRLGTTFKDRENK
jgi:Na+-transporting methylmalonyl-CoA/oxaloacetate decarboxylase gamma subunit